MQVVGKIVHIKTVEQKRGKRLVATFVDETGQMAGIRYGLQNESARLNLNVLPTLEESGAALVAVTSMMGSEEDMAASGTDPGNLAHSLLLGLPNMTPEIADMSVPA